MIARRDVESAFAVPATYFFIALFLLASGLLAFLYLHGFSEFSASAREQAATDPTLLERVSIDTHVVQHVMRWLILLLIVVVPLLTMRSLAEERRSGTMELLLTAPVSPTGLVLGKFAGAVLLVLTPVALTAWFPLALIAVAEPDLGSLATGYLGVALAAGAFTAVGLLCSALTDSPLLAAFSCFVLLVLSSLGGVLADGARTAAGELAGRLSVLQQLRPFTQGVVDSGALVHVLAVTAGLLFLTQRVLESRRWR